MKTLTHDQQIKMRQFRYKPKVVVGTAEGYAKEYNEDPEAAVKRCLKNGHAIAWTNQSAAALTADYPGKAADMAAKEAAYDNALELENGESVEIEGREYVVKFMGDYSDPVHFIPVHVITA